MKTAIHTKPRLNSRACFSLMEVMISVLILAMISTLIYASFSRALEVPDYLRNIQERYHKVRVAMERMISEISMAYLSKHVDPSYEDAPNYIFRVKENNPGSRIDFTAFAHMKMHEDSNESDQCEIGYFLEQSEDKKDTYNLMRREQNRIDHEPGWGGIKRVLAEDISDFKILVWNALDEEWVEEWDTTQIEQYQSIPKMVAIELTIEDENGEDLTFYTKVQILLQKPVDLTNI